MCPPVSCKRLSPLLLGLGLLLARSPVHAQSGGEAPASAPAPSEPQEARAASGEAVPSRPESKPKSAKENGRSRIKLSRFYVKVRPLVSIEHGAVPGGVFELGGDYVGKSGVWVGGEISPLVVSGLLGGRPSFSSRLILGYGSKYFGVAAGIGTGYNSTREFGGIGLLQVGPVLRFGSITGTHVRLRFSFSLFVPWFLPNSGDVELNIKVHERVRLQLNVAGDFGLFGIYSSLGTQILFGGNGGPGTHILTVGVGAAGVALLPGVTATVGYEARF
jgi:hypothetical protein